MSSIYHAIMNMISKLVTQGSPYNVEGTPFVMGYQVLDVFQQKGTWSFRCDYTCNIKEQGSLSLILKTVSTPESIFLGHACDGERLAGESSEKYIVVGNVTGADFGYITVQFVTV